MNKKSSRQELSERNRITLAYLELAKDKMFKQLTDKERLDLIHQVLAIGDDAAHWAEHEYRTNDPRKIAVKMGLRVFGESRSALKRSEYRKKKREIAISKKFHEKLIRLVDSSELSEHLLKFMVANELFHHLEEEKLGEIYKRYRFKSWKFGSYVRHKFIKGISDVAAQAFTQTLLKLEISPKIFDYLTYILFTHK